MHPTLRHVPPREPLASTQAVLKPNCPALIAAAYPPGPPPTITTSYWSVGWTKKKRLFPNHWHFNNKKRRKDLMTMFKL